MALWANYSIANDDIYLVVTVRWKLTAGGAVLHTDTWRLNLDDDAVVEGGPSAVADRLIRRVRERAYRIDRGVNVYNGLAAALGAPQNTDIQLL